MRYTDLWFGRTDFRADCLEAIRYHVTTDAEWTESKGYNVFKKHGPQGYKTPLPGIQMKTLCYGERTLMTEFILSRGSTLPVHAHPYEQTGYLVQGHVRLTIDGESYDVTPGDSWSIPSTTEHGAQILEDSVAIEIFSPVREDYLPDDTETPDR
jgi:quercetin dioxygenase-like cupin family protein